MKLDRKAITARALKHHAKDGRVLKALNKIFNTTYPVGTNLVLEFIKEFIGLPYGAKDMCMDRVVDCAELWRITFFIWFGIDIGNNSDAQYLNGAGVIVTRDFNALSKCHLLDLVFYKTSLRKKSGHVSAIFDARRIFHSGAGENGARVNYSKITWGKRYFTSKMYVKRFLTAEQIASVTVGADETPVPVTPKSRELELLTNHMKGEDVRAVQRKLIALGYDLGKWKDDGDFGTYTHDAVVAFQRKNKLHVDGVVGEQTTKALGLAWIE